MINSSDENSPIVGLRMNSIKIDYNSIATSPASSRPIKQYNCAVRVDIYNSLLTKLFHMPLSIFDLLERTKKLQYRTFDSGILAIDISKFVSTAHTEKASYIRVLSTLDNRTNNKTYRSFTDFDSYYGKYYEMNRWSNYFLNIDDRLHEIYKTNEKYKPITNLIQK